MSFDLEVYVPTIPQNLNALWVEALAKAGLHCELPPWFDAAAWADNFLAIKVEVDPAKVPTVAQHGVGPWVAGIELDISDYDPVREPVSWAPPEFQERLRRMRRRFAFCTHMGRSALDLRLQCFAAATLAVLADGVVVDPQSGQCLAGKDALTNAAREVAEFEDGAEPEVWQLTPFPGWDELGEGFPDSEPSQ